MPMGPNVVAGIDDDVLSDRVAGQVDDLFDGAVVEDSASGSCAAGAGDGITAGSIGWTTITLAPGRYELVCNLTNHYANVMYAELVVT